MSTTTIKSNNSKRLSRRKQAISLLADKPSATNKPDAWPLMSPGPWPWRDYAPVNVTGVVKNPGASKSQADGADDTHTAALVRVRAAHHLWMMSS